MHAIDPDKGSRGWSPEQWRNVDELCKTIIALNVKDFAPLFGREMQKASAAQMWKWLEVLDHDGIMAPHMHMWNDAHTSWIRLEEVEDKPARAGSGWGAFVNKTVTVVCLVALFYALFYAPQLQQRC
ncbi:hypothetical protein DICSQDRAFT_133539 [Dichomitus squalens LYAD-421 SS1]|uniref:uncharacterized protein n=1 Tax=Dichomitus squalens (strain LYAD-421) TaxID=732165 RepID=UPI0004415B49|nr:uncharacterized protein DICSQDRAFT_133539 [Dichomitus squalens LYAD-421 SS1]EJF64830.1 hypothetical protein DICSQDRAFT_133539 [Dichomitus squalens LYAD-421 SS1]